MTNEEELYLTADSKKALTGLLAAGKALISASEYLMARELEQFGLVQVFMESLGVFGWRITKAGTEALGTGKVNAAKVQPPASNYLQPKLSGFTGDICGQCGQAMMTRSGSCLYCQNCGATTGCS